METIKEILMRRDGNTSEEADERIEEALDELQIYIEEGNIFDAEYICEDHFGLEPDYLMELINMLG
jgi:predicted RNase H-like HicB family nuclease